MPHFGIRGERYKLIYFYGQGSFWELIDLKTYPDELHNIYDNPQHKTLIAKMKKELRALMLQYNDNEAVAILDRDPS
jgi:choline-sulfatase